MTGYAGVLKIVRFNWPLYALALVVTLGGLALIASGVLPRALAMLALAGLGAANGWLVLSLVVSHWVYDRSPIARGGWLEGIEPADVRRCAVFHAGHDEASRLAAEALPQAEIQVFDFYDQARNGTPSLERARSVAQAGGAPAVSIRSDRIPLPDAGLELGLLVFAAHEIRDDAERAAFFGELERVLAPGGRLILVEHLRDGWNFLAYGPGAFHFLSRATWRRSVERGGLRILGERRCTPFVRILELGRGN